RTKSGGYLYRLSSSSLPTDRSTDGRWQDQPPKETLPSVRQCKHDTCRKVCTVGPGGACRSLKMEIHAADFHFPRHRMVDWNIDSGSKTCGEATAGSVAVRCRCSEISYPEAGQHVRRNAGCAISRLAAEQIGNQCHTATQAVDAHVVL